MDIWRLSIGCWKMGELTPVPMTTMHFVGQPRMGIDPSAADNYAILWAARKGHLAVVNRLLEDGRVDPSAVRKTTIRWTAQNGHLDVVHRLLRDRRVYQASPFIEFSHDVRRYTFGLFRTNSLPFDFASSISNDDLQYNAQVRTTLKETHNCALAHTAMLLQSSTLAGLDDQDAQIHILWMSFGNVTFPFIPVDERRGRISQLAACVNAAGRHD